ncbi:MAG: Fe-S cluster assembly protein SufD [Elusimicrobia bacterium]|nr:Fe-S cluster assembly protein SufD [Elusimicrobiota bacterium]
MTTVAETSSTLDDLRREAWDGFRAATAPAKTSEFWRRFDFSKFRLDEVQPPSPCVATRPAAIERGGAAGVLRQAAGLPDAAVDLDPALESQGVVFTTLEKAFASHPNLVKPALMRCAGPDLARLEAANSALWRGGAFLYVPNGVRIERAFDVGFLGAGRHAFPRLVAVIGDDAEATVIEDHSDSADVSAAFGRLRVGRGARLNFFYNQGLPKTATHFWNQRIDLAQDAQLKHTSILLGGGLHKSNVHVELLGQGARSELFGVVFGGARQFFDTTTWQMHRGPRTQSDLLFKAALKDRARSVYTGMIRVEKEAIGSDAFQQNNNLLLSDTARADTTPVLEILTDQVRCKHGATMGPVSAEELFYLGCRGLEPKEATKALVMGFFEPILAQVPLERLKAELPGRVERGLEP